MDPDRLRLGMYVLWDPDERSSASGLEPGHPGIITDPSWQDVGVRWLFREGQDVSQYVYDYRFLREASVEEFVEAAYGLLTRQRQNAAKEGEQ